MHETFPIMWPIMLKEQRALKAAGVEMTRGIPWAMIAPHEKQAERNHDQTLTRLAERGGLSACEAVAILEDRRWTRLEHAVAYRQLQELVRAWKDKTDGKETDQARASAAEVDQD